MENNKKNSLRSFIGWSLYAFLLLFNGSFRAALERLTWSRKDMEGFQLKRLKTLVTYAYNKSPFYKKFYDDAGINPEFLHTLEDMQKFPVLTKEVLRKAIADKTIFTAKNIPGGTLETSTTGSSGDPLTLYFDFGSRKQRYINSTRAFWMMGVFPYKKFAWLWRKKSMSLRKKIRTMLGLFLFVPVVDVVEASRTAMDKDAILKILHDLIAFKPEVIRGYASTLWVMAQLVKKYNLPLRPERVIASAEYLPPLWWDEMEKIFQCPVHNIYGGTEAAPIATSRAGERSLMVFQDFYFTEIINQYNTWTEPHETGRIIITDYNSSYMPLIRYEIGDVAEWEPEPETPSGPFPRFASVGGRINDIFLLPGGKMLFSHNWHIYFRDVDSISRFKVIQRDISTIDIYIEPTFEGTEWNDELIALKEKIGQSFDDNVTLRWEIVSKLPSDKGDKFRSVKSEISVDEIVKNL